MKVSKNENEITIKIKKEDLIFNKLNQVENIYKFIEYCIDLEGAINGYDSGELPCYECLELYKEKNKNITKEKIKLDIEECLKIIKTCLNDILEVAGNEYANSFMMDDGYASIDDSDNIRLMWLFFERLQYLVQLKEVM